MELSLEQCIVELERRTAELCAPTLVGIKPSSTFSFPLFQCVGFDAAGNQIIARITHPIAEEAVHVVQCKLEPLGIRFMPLALRSHTVMVYAWRPELMGEFFASEPTATMLDIEGYDVDNVYGCIDQLKARIASFDACPRDAAGNNRFPHEIGFFLGYPLDDVLAFVRHRACGIKLRGCWNVYTDMERACRIFDLYHAATAHCMVAYGTGDPIESLACPGVDRLSPAVHAAYGLA